MPKTNMHGDRKRAGVRLAALAVAAGLLGLSGCASASASAERADDRPVVVATFTVIADMVRDVAGDDVRVVSLTKPGVPIHDYEPTPSDLVRATDADLVVTNGLGVDAWLERQLRNRAPIVELATGIEPIPISTGHWVGHPNPHAWMSPVEASRSVETVRAALTALVPERADALAERASLVTEQLEALRMRLVEGVAALPPAHRILITCEGAFSYLVRDAGLEEASLWPVNAGGQGTPQSIAHVAQLATSREVPTLFCESTTHPGTQQEIAASAGSRFDGSLFVDSLSGPDGPAPTYLAMLEHDIDRILAGLA